MSEPPPAAMEASSVGDLVALRLMLDDAARRAATSHQYTRGSAVVALDATVERAAYLVVTRRNVRVPAKATLDDLHSALVQDMGREWKPTMWGQVRNLRHARNGAQHHSLVPAAEAVSGWVAAATSYVTSLVAAEYGVALDRVVLADAVNIPTLAGYIRQAQQALETDDVPASVESSLAAFDSAVSWWSAMHHRDRRSPAGPYHPQLGHMGFNPGAEAIGALERAAAEASFASSAAEHEWFNTTRREPVELLDDEDAERILTFAFSWVVSLELATAQWAPDRRRRARIAARNVRTSADHARIDRILPATLWPPFVDVTFVLADVPAEEDYDDWAHTLSTMLNPDRGDRWVVGADGSVTLHTPSAEPPNATDVTSLATALDRVEEAMARKAAAEADAERALAAEIAAHQRDVEAVRHRMPDWVTSLTWGPSGPGRPTQWMLTVADAVVHLRFDNPDGSFQPLGIWALVQDEDTHAMTGAAGQGVLPGTLELEHVLRLLEGADNAVQSALAKARDEEQAHQRAVADIDAALAAALARTRSTGSTT